MTSGEKERKKESFHFCLRDDARCMEDDDMEINWFLACTISQRLALDSEDRETSASCKNGCAKRLQNDGCFNDSMSLTIHYANLQQKQTRRQNRI